MPPRKKRGAEFPDAPTMAQLRDTLWKAADKLRGSMDAAQYKDFVLGLVFLKYVSDAFVERREEIRASLVADGIPESRAAVFLDDKDEYAGHGVFWVPERARWSFLAASAKSGAFDGGARVGIGRLVDQAMEAVMKENDALDTVLPKIFNQPNVDQRRLAELVDLISDARFTGHRVTPEAPGTPSDSAAAAPAGEGTLFPVSGEAAVESPCPRRPRPSNAAPGTFSARSTSTSWRSSPRRRANAGASSTRRRAW